MIIIIVVIIMNKDRFKFCGVLVGALSSLSAEERSKNSDVSYHLGKIVTSASGFDQDIKEAPASISVITGKDLLDRPVRDLVQRQSQKSAG